MATSISKIHAREILDSRGNPTIEVNLVLADGSVGRAMVPSGASKGQREVLELRDGDPKRYGGKGVLKACRIVNETIFGLLEGKKFDSVSDLDHVLLQADGTEQKSRLGANSILGVSLSYAHAVADSLGKPLYSVIAEWMGVKHSQLRMPLPLMNILNGGVHANNGLEFQEFMIVPHGFSDFSESLRAGAEVFQTLKKILNDQGYSTAVGDEGGFAPSLGSNEKALEMIAQAIDKAGYKIGDQISLALDVASSSFFDEKSKAYVLNSDKRPKVSSAELIEYYVALKKKYPIVSIEDGLDEKDWSGWHVLTEKLGHETQLVGDDLFVTQKKWVEKGIREKVANSVLIKVNQVGTLSETIETMEMCRVNKYSAVVSHRSGETEDATIAHLAVGSGCGQIKTGSLSRGERTSKYNELLRIEEQAKLSKKPIPVAEKF